MVRRFKRLLISAAFVFGLMGATSCFGGPLLAPGTIDLHLNTKMDEYAVLERIAAYKWAQETYLQLFFIKHTNQIVGNIIRMFSYGL